MTSRTLCKSAAARQPNLPPVLLAATFVLLVTAPLGGCGEGSAASPTASGGSDAGSMGGKGAASSVDAGDGGELSPCAVTCTRYNAQCGAQQTCSSFCEIYRDDFNECLPEFDAFFACAAIDTSFRFDCAQYFALQFGSCEREFHTLHYCDRAGGLECRPEPNFDASCTAGVNPRPPHYTYCRLDATPPAGCVPYSTTSEYPIAFCCP